MNVKRFKIFIVVFIALCGQTAFAESVRDLVNNANKLYSENKYNEAINKYEQALTESPEAAEPKFNKADSYYRLDDLEKATKDYEEVAAKSKNMQLVAKAKYNLGNTYFQQGTKQKDSNLQKALEDYKTSIGYWRNALDIDPQNEKAKQNIETTRLIIKDIIDQINKQKKDPNQPQDPNQQQQQNQSQKQEQKDSQQNQQDKKEQDDPNNSNENKDKQQQNKQEQKQNEPNKPSDANQPKEQNQQQEQKKEDEQKVKPPDATAQEILDKEKKQRNERQKMLQGQYQKVEKDW